MRTYIDFMIDEANEAHNVDLRNLPATAPLFAYLHAASLGAVECKYKHVALELAKLAAAYYLQTAEADDRWYGFAAETCEGEEADDIIHAWANAERNKYSYGLHNGALGISFLSEDARHWYTIAITVDPETGKQLTSERVNFPDEVSLMLHDYYAAAQNRQ